MVVAQQPHEDLAQETHESALTVLMMKSTKESKAQWREVGQDGRESNDSSPLRPTEQPDDIRDLYHESTHWAGNLTLLAENLQHLKLSDTLNKSDAAVLEMPPGDEPPVETLEKSGDSLVPENPPELDESWHTPPVPTPSLLEDDDRVMKGELRALILFFLPFYPAGVATFNCLQLGADESEIQ